MMIEYRNIWDYDLTIETHVFKDGEEVKPIMRKSMDCGHGRMCEYVGYDAEDVWNADLVLRIETTNLGDHYCDVEVRRPNPKSVAAALSIHSCPRILEKLKRLGAI